jgi:hypothetical protein
MAKADSVLSTPPTNTPIDTISRKAVCRFYAVDRRYSNPAFFRQLHRRPPQEGPRH